MQSKQSHSRHSSREKVSSNESTHRAAKSIGDASLCGIFVKADTAPDTVADFANNLPKHKIWYSLENQFTEMSKIVASLGFERFSGFQNQFMMTKYVVRVQIFVTTA